MEGKLQSSFYGNNSTIQWRFMLNAKKAVMNKQGHKNNKKHNKKRDPKYAVYKRCLRFKDINRLKVKGWETTYHANSNHKKEWLN